MGGALAVAVPVVNALVSTAGGPLTDPSNSSVAGVGALTIDTVGRSADAAEDVRTVLFDDGSATAAAIVPVATGVLEPAEPAGVPALLKAAGLAEAAQAAAEAEAAALAAREEAARCAADLDGLGRVKPWVREAAGFLSCLYDHPDLIGVASRARASDHPRGLALDLMVRGARGDRIADCALANQDELGITYVIWEQKINHGDGWKRMSNRGGDTENHYDHVHISFTGGGADGGALAHRCS